MSGENSVGSCELVHFLSSRRLAQSNQAIVQLAT